MLITSNSFELENDTVAIAGSGANFNFPSSTTFLNGAATQGFIAGTVLDVWGHSISAPSAISVSPGLAGNSTTADTVTGRYVLRVSTGFVNVTANPSNANTDYISVSSLSVPVALGQITDNVNFILSQGGRTMGWVTRDGINALPGVTVAAIDANGYERDSEVTNVSGNFTTINMATGTYTLQPALDSLSVSSPTSLSATILAGTDVFVGSFTILGALGTITGSATSGGQPINTGVLIVVTTSTLSGSPPAVPSLSTGVTPGIAYLTSSQENGTYSISVRQSTSPTYNVYGYYYTAVSTMPIWSKVSNVSVTAGTTTYNVNFAW